MSETLLGPVTRATTLPLLADPSGYVACRWNLTEMPEPRRYWLGLFERHLPTLLDQGIAEMIDRGIAEADARQRAESVQEQFNAFLRMLGDDPAALGEPLTIMHLCLKREAILEAHGFDDPYRLAKHRENEQALKLLPAVLEQLDQLNAQQRELAVIQGVFAGNIFDLGATQTVERFQDSSVDFHAILNDLKPRPWLVDDLDAFVHRWRDRGYAHALLFVDNAGPDVCIGMMALARELLRRGSDVILTANSNASLNDVTADELQALLQRVAGMDSIIREALREGRLRVLGNGNNAPLIDLSRLDAGFVEQIAERPIDLVVLEGMGRAIESNYEAQLTCDTLKLAMIKDQGVADAMQGELYDLVLRFEPGKI